MQRFILRRLLITIPVLLGVATVVFLVLRVIPGDPAVIMAGDTARYEDIQLIRHKLGLDRPLYVQYLDYLWKASRGDLGFSLQTGRDVSWEILSRLPATLDLALASIALALGIGLPLGVYAAVKRRSWADRSVLLCSVLGISLPSFWVGLMLIIVFSVQLGFLPTGGKDGLAHFILPSITLALIPLFIIARTMRSSMLEVLQRDYLRTARGKGLPEVLVIGRHALRNALIPVITIVGLNFGAMLSGAVIVETVFAWPGIGRLLIDSVNFRDFPMVQGITLVFATLFIMTNLLVDVAYAVIDPRIRYR
ncbi:MAG: ABC transporter permease [Chloroflexi bacterium]|nr:ABC transporter permease [Chloroflexota bacterium]